MIIDPSEPGRFSALLTRYRPALAAAGGLAGLLIGVYSDQARSMIGWTGSHVLAGGTLVALAAVAVFSLAWWARGRLERSRARGRAIVARSFDIHPDDFDDDLPSDHAVIGRELRYLERRTSSSHLVVLLHGLGLDASDFRPFMNAAPQHTVGITTFGHNTAEATDGRYRAIGLATHADLISGAINNLSRQYPHKKITLVGFSVGADMLFRLAELWTDHPDRRPPISSALLLDPNINHSTMIITGRMARLNPDEPLAELLRVAHTPSSLIEFQNICEYLHKISEKDLDQIRRYAADLWEYWEPDGRYDLFVRRLERLQSVCRGGLRVLFSTHFEHHFNDVMSLARQRGLRQVFDLRRVDHFELLRETFLTHEVDTLLRR
ncbi:hypothetical protein [Actinacidiphila acididurans]|uniref:Alpha/beta hydrolase family protein n=1 Tax=Actinacidiphila acididurans TaxID=2784346 RepID=A0ABS2TRB6_9ACTN|nr:hypothetical protein [Actinacidiphila acididurans]MBM9504503.1 hypothetical protein [Actinacidiphila acididurans]